MDKREEFKKAAGIIANKFKETKKGIVKVVSNLDTDGITSASILITAFRRDGIKFSMTFVKQLNKNVLRTLSRDLCKTIIFSDLGSSVISNIKNYLNDKNIFIFDHHIVENDNKDINQLNPHLFGLDNYNEISAAGVCYFFAKALNEKNSELAHMAFIGAVGDLQEYKGVIGLNKEILDDAVNSGKVEVKTGLRIFGYQTKPLHKVLEYCIDPYIPGVSGSESGAVAFLNECGIKPSTEIGWRKLIDLDNEELKKLVTGIILRRIGSEEIPDDVLGSIYTLGDEEEGSPMKDIREYATLLNACARLGKAGLGVGVLLNKSVTRRKALDLLDEYRKMIVGALEWFHNNKKSNYVYEGKGFVIINAGDNVIDSIIGVLNSIISRSGIYPNNTIIVSIANNLEGDLKASIRVSGLRGNEDINLKNLLSEIVDGLDAELGGHKLAAGSLVSVDKEEQFINNIKSVLSNRKV